MNDPFISAMNTQKAALGWLDSISYNLSNVYTHGFKQTKTRFSDFLGGIEANEFPRDPDQGKSIPGRGPDNLFIEGKGYFMVRKDDGNILFTRLGDFSFNGEGTLVNEAGEKVQGYLLGEDGSVIDSMQSEPPPGLPNANNPPHTKGGPGHTPTTEINLWVDPSNGKFFGKYDEYKIRSDGTVVGLANKGKTVVPLYRVALANFVNPDTLSEVEDNKFVPTQLSGEPVAGSGEIRTGLLEMSNTSIRTQVGFLQQAKMQLDITSKLISTNKNLLEEALRLIQ